MKEKKQKFLFRFKSIQTTILLLFFVLIMVSLTLFLIISSNYTKKSIVKNSTDYTRQLIDQVNENIDYYISYMDNTSQMVSRNFDVQEYLFGQNISDEESDLAKNRVLNQFQTIMNSRSDIRNVAVIADNGKTLINQGYSRLNPYNDIRLESWFQKARTLKSGEFILSDSHVQNAIADSYPWVITMSRPLYNSLNKMVDGVMLIDLNYSTINDLCRSVSLGKEGYIYVIDKNGKIIYHPKQQLLYSGLKGEEVESIMKLYGEEDSFIKSGSDGTKVYTAATSSKTGWTVVGVSYMADLLKDWDQANMTYVITAVILVFAGATFAVFTSRRVTRPIKLLDISMREVAKGNFDIIPPKEVSPNEIGRLETTFYQMMQEIRTLTAQNIEEQKQKRKAEIRALQAQINPHFLYNTLDSIIWMAEGGRHNQEVVLMTSSLAKLLRQSIGNREELVTIAQEVEYTKTYLTIQGIRYKDKLEFEASVDTNVQNRRIVKLTLQPLVENAIYHGIKYLDHKGMISIKGYQEGKDIVLEVRDNGTGMDEQELREVFTKKESKSSTGGVGVYNVQNRLQLYYGKEYGLEYISKKGEGTVVKITIPTAEEDTNEIEK